MRVTLQDPEISTCIQRRGMCMPASSGENEAYIPRQPGCRKRGRTSQTTNTSAIGALVIQGKGA